MTNSDKIKAAAKKAGYSTRKEYHTFNQWNSLGYNVKRGSHALFTCVLWYGKPCRVSLFSEDQVTPTDEKAAELYREMEEKALQDEENARKKQIRNFVRSTKISISSVGSSNIPDFNSYRIHHINGVILSRSGAAIDSFYQELSGMFPDVFPDDITNPTDQLLFVNDAIAC